MLYDTDPCHLHKPAQDFKIRLLVPENWVLEKLLAAYAGHFRNFLSHIFDLIASKQDLVYFKLLLEAFAPFQLLVIESATGLEAFQALLKALRIISEEQVDGAFVDIKVKELRAESDLVA